VRVAELRRRVLVCGMALLVVACVTDPAPTAAPTGSSQATPAASDAPTTSPRPGPTPVPSDLRAGATIVTAGLFHTCALRVGGKVACWGQGFSGQVGETGESAISATPVDVPGLANIVGIDAGGLFTCALRRSGSVWCWGSNGAGELGDGTRGGSHPVPQRVPGIRDAIDLSAGDRHACVVLRNGGVRCWGVNFQGQIGDGTKVRRLRRVAVETPSKAAAVSAGGGVTCALLVDATVACWGENNIFGAVGDGGRRDRLVPTAVVGVSGATQVAAGASHACAAIEDGSVRCWGANSFGQVGSGRAGPGRYRLPVPVAGLDDVVAIAAGEWTTCAVDAAGAAWCWGLNQNGQLGSELVERSASPLEVLGLTGAIDITTNAGHSCSVTGDFEVWCWGSNDVGQLGRGEPVGPGFGSSVPVQVVGLG
jgi:alpha-tubulin suppressor-like RCC1 family protein